MKKGKIYCIKDYSEITNNFYFKKNKTYKFENTTVHYSFSCRTVHIILFDENNNALRFNIYSPFAKDIFPYHFKTEKEIRKIKLEKLRL